MDVAARANRTGVPADYKPLGPEAASVLAAPAGAPFSNLSNSLVEQDFFGARFRVFGACLGPHP